VRESSSERRHHARPLLAIMKHSVKKLARQLGYDIRYVGREHLSEGARTQSDLQSVSYQENPEVGPVNYAEKEARVKAGGPFEWPNMVALNRAVVTLIGPARRIVELGGGTGCFAYEAAAAPERFVVCSELDQDAIRWAQENRNLPNIQYVNRLVTADEGLFDLVVAIDVIEHIQDYRSFLETCVALAPHAIITTPNKNRDPQAAIASPPAYYQHVREWTAGEFYWVLRAFYQSVKLYSMPNVCIPQVVPIRITDTLTPLIAICGRPY